jgi:hypothetical protein
MCDNINEPEALLRIYVAAALYNGLLFKMPTKMYNA